VDDSYPYEVLAIRADDGTYVDRVFNHNYAWGCNALDSGRLQALLIYSVYRPNWGETVDTLKRTVGDPHQGTAFMIDAESWGGQIRGDNSDGLNHMYWGITDWLGTSGRQGPRRVCGYGNVSDLNELWPTRPDHCPLIIAAYGSNSDYPDKLGHQFTDGVYGGPIYVPPFGMADVNSADGYDAAALKAALGITFDPAAPTAPGGIMATLDQDDINAITASVTKWLADYIAGFVGPIGHDVKRVADALGLARDDAGFDAKAPGKPQGGNRSLYDLIAAQANRAGVPGTTDTNPTGAAQ
jgi:hypothetical protein